MAAQKSAVRGAQINTQPSTGGTEPQEATPYSQALSRLEPLQPVLAGIAHRNHNQHRRAAWWRYFGMLRRNCAKFVENLVVAVEAARKHAARAAKAAKAKSKKRRREQLVSGEAGAGEDEKDSLSNQRSGFEMESVTRHAVWLQDVLTPKCYLAFSQLTADNQFAPLGVVLLGVLAQVKAACDCVAPRPVEPLVSSPSAHGIPAAGGVIPSVEVPTIAAEKRSATVTPALEPGLAMSEGQPAHEGDLGTRPEASRGGGKAISRADVERAVEQRGTGKETGKIKAKREMRTVTVIANGRADTLNEEPSSTSSDKRRVLSEQVDRDESVRPAKKVKTTAATKEKARGENKNDFLKKKKKAKKGDEFDDLFKGLF